jgi:hypothetical protein
MEEKIKFYESALVPLLKKRNSDLIIAVSELESNLLMADAKIRSLQERIDTLESSSNASVLADKNVNPLEKKRQYNKKQK